MQIQWPTFFSHQTAEGGKLSPDTMVLRAGDQLAGTVLAVENGRDALLSLGQFNAYARMPVPVVSGQKVQIQVASGGNQELRLMMVPQQEQGQQTQSGGSLDIRLFEPVPERPFLSSHASMLKAGELLEGRITGFEKDGLKLVDFGRFKAFTKIDFPVRQGQVVPLQVVRSGQEITLALAARPRGADASGLKPASFPRAVPNQTAVSGQTAPVMPPDLTLPTSGSGQAAPATPPSPPLPTNGSGQAAPATPPNPSLQTNGSGQAAPATPPNPSLQTNGSGQAVPSMPPDPTVQTAGKAGAAPPAPSTSGEMTVLRDQIQRLLEEPSRVSGLVKTVDLPDPMRRALVNLQQILTPATPGGDTRNLAARVSAFVENSGIYFEKRLAETIRTTESRSGPLPATELAAQPEIRNLMVNDLKPNLLVLKQFLDAQPQDAHGSGRHLLETLKSVVHRAVSHIEQQQLGAVEKPVDPDVLQAFSHLLFLTENSRNAQLKVYYARKGRDGEHIKPRVSLLLDMDPMGAVRTDLWMVARDLNITFFVPNADIQALVQREQHRIGKALQPVFNTVAVTVVINEKKIEAFEGEALFQPSRRQLDVSV